MNKIVIKGYSIDSSVLDSNIICESNESKTFSGVMNLFIKVLSDSSLILEFKNSSNMKFNIDIEINDNAKLRLIEYNNSKNMKMKYTYDLNKDVEVEVYKFYDVFSIKESISINLNKENSKIYYLFKTISKENEKYDITIKHNAKNTVSDINNIGTNINDGNLSFNLSTFIPSGSISCTANQNSRIVNLTDNKCIINPNLFIDENDVNANHSAHIGKFSDEELFYLNSRGIDDNLAVNLLINGILKRDMPDILINSIEDSIKKYWEG